MGKPIIGIVAKPALENDMWHYMDIVDEIRHVLIKNNALVIGILPSNRILNFKLDDELEKNNFSIEEKKDLELILQNLDGVVLEGGLVSNYYEEEIAKICIKKDIPLLGICSGFNNLIRALGGTVQFDSNPFHNQYGKEIAHEVNIIKDSKLFSILKKDTIMVNSIHTGIAFKSDVKEYKIASTCPLDNSVEAIELEGNRFVMGIKWHPELMESMNPIFEEFVQECSK